MAKPMWAEIKSGAFQHALKNTTLYLKHTKKKPQLTREKDKICWREESCLPYRAPTSFNSAQVTEGWQDTVSTFRRDDPNLAQDLVVPWGGTWDTISSAWEGLDRTSKPFILIIRQETPLLRTGIYEAYLSKMRRVWLQPCSPFSLAHQSNLNHTN